MRDLLCRLTRAERSSLGHSAGDDFEELNNVAGSGLEKAWLRYIKDNGYRLPDRGQPYLEAFDTRPDFAYTTHQTLVYIDGPHHRGDRQNALDAEITRRLQDAGFTVVRFDEDRESWDRVVDEYAWIFGPGASSESN